MKCTVNFKSLGRGKNPNSPTVISLFIISCGPFLRKFGQADYKLKRGEGK